MKDFTLWKVKQSFVEKIKSESSELKLNVLIEKMEWEEDFKWKGRDQLNPVYIHSAFVLYNDWLFQKGRGKTHSEQLYDVVEDVKENGGRPEIFASEGWTVDCSLPVPRLV